MRPMFRQGLKLFSALPLVFLGLAGSGLAQSTKAMLPLTISHLPIVPYASAIVAEAEGYFKEQGLDVKRKVLIGTDVIRSGLSSGEIDIAAMSVDAVVRGHLAGFGWKIVYPAIERGRLIRGIQI